MNPYGRLLMTQWREADPARYQAIPTPEAFFTRLGEEVEKAIDLLADELARALSPRLDQLEDLARLTMARMQAEEIVLADLTIQTSPSDDDGSLDVSLVTEVNAVLDRASAEDDS